MLTDFSQEAVQKTQKSLVEEPDVDMMAGVKNDVVSYI